VVLFFVVSFLSRFSLFYCVFVVLLFALIVWEGLSRLLAFYLVCFLFFGLVCLWFVPVVWW